MGEDPGSVFVVRNVANLVFNTDFILSRRRVILTLLLLKGETESEP
jgi:carbonic anhydrase